MNQVDNIFIIGLKQHVIQVVFLNNSIWTAVDDVHTARCTSLRPFSLAIFRISYIACML